MCEKLILDATCGARQMWFDKYNENTIYVDKRVEHDVVLCNAIKEHCIRRITVDPDVVADFTNLPFEDESFYLVVFDPPHLKQLGETSWMFKKYGRLADDWALVIHDGFEECMRVLKPYGTLIFKWSEVQIPVKDVIRAIGYEPLFGNKTGLELLHMDNRLHHPWVRG